MCAFVQLWCDFSRPRHAAEPRHGGRHDVVIAREQKARLAAERMREMKGLPRRLVTCRRRPCPSRRGNGWPEAAAGGTCGANKFVSAVQFLGEITTFKPPLR